MPLQNQLAAKQLIPTHVRRTDELRDYLKMRLPYAYGTVGGFTIFQHEEVSQKRLRAVEMGTFSEGGPKVKGTAHRFRCPVVEIVAERRSDLRLGFNGRNQRLVANYEKVPFFCGPEEAWKLNGFFPEYMCQGGCLLG